MSTCCSCNLTLDNGAKPYSINGLGIDGVPSVAWSLDGRIHCTACSETLQESSSSSSSSSSSPSLITTLTHLFASTFADPSVHPQRKQILTAWLRCFGSELVGTETKNSSSSSSPLSLLDKLQRLPPLILSPENDNILDTVNHPSYNEATETLQNILNENISGRNDIDHAINTTVLPAVYRLLSSSWKCPTFPLLSPEEKADIVAIVAAQGSNKAAGNVPLVKELLLRACKAYFPYLADVLLEALLFLNNVQTGSVVEALISNDGKKLRGKFVEAFGALGQKGYVPPNTLLQNTPRSSRSYTPTAVPTGSGYTVSAATMMNAIEIIAEFTADLADTLCIPSQVNTNAIALTALADLSMDKLNKLNRDIEKNYKNFTIPSTSSSTSNGTVSDSTPIVTENGSPDNTTSASKTTTDNEADGEEGEEGSESTKPKVGLGSLFSKKSNTSSTTATATTASSTTPLPYTANQITKAILNRPDIHAISQAIELLMLAIDTANYLMRNPRTLPLPSVIKLMDLILLGGPTAFYDSLPGIASPPAPTGSLFTPATSTTGTNPYKYIVISNRSPLTATMGTLRPSSAYTFGSTPSSSVGGFGEVSVFVGSMKGNLVKFPGDVSTTTTSTGFGSISSSSSSALAYGISSGAMGLGTIFSTLSPSVAGTTGAATLFSGYDNNLVNNVSNLIVKACKIIPTTGSSSSSTATTTAFPGGGFTFNPSSSSSSLFGSSSSTNYSTYSGGFGTTNAFGTTPSVFGSTSSSSSSSSTSSSSSSSSTTATSGTATTAQLTTWGGVIPFVRDALVATMNGRIGDPLLNCDSVTFGCILLAARENGLSKNCLNRLPTYISRVTVPTHTVNDVEQFMLMLRITIAVIYGGSYDSNTNNSLSTVIRALEITLPVIPEQKPVSRLSLLRSSTTETSTTVASSTNVSLSTQPFSFMSPAPAPAPTSFSPSTASSSSSFVNPHLQLAQDEEQIAKSGGIERKLVFAFRACSDILVSKGIDPLSLTDLAVLSDLERMTNVCRGAIAPLPFPVKTTNDTSTASKSGKTTTKTVTAARTKAKAPAKVAATKKAAAKISLASSSDATPVDNDATAETERVDDNGEIEEGTETNKLGLTFGKPSVPTIDNRDICDKVLDTVGGLFIKKARSFSLECIAKHVPLCSNSNKYALHCAIEQLKAIRDNKCTGATLVGISSNDTLVPVVASNDTLATELASYRRPFVTLGVDTPKVRALFEERSPTVEAGIDFAGCSAIDLVTEYVRKYVTASSTTTTTTVSATTTNDTLVLDVLGKNLPLFYSMTKSLLSSLFQSSVGSIIVTDTSNTTPQKDVARIKALLRLAVALASSMDTLPILLTASKDSPSKTGKDGKGNKATDTDKVSNAATSSSTATETVVNYPFVTYLEKDAKTGQVVIDDGCIAEAIAGGAETAESDSKNGKYSYGGSKSVTAGKKKSTKSSTTVTTTASSSSLASKTQIAKDYFAFLPALQAMVNQLAITDISSNRDITGVMLSDTSISKSTKCKYCSKVFMAPIFGIKHLLRTHADKFTSTLPESLREILATEGVEEVLPLLFTDASEATAVLSDPSALLSSITSLDEEITSDVSAEELVPMVSRLLTTTHSYISGKIAEWIKDPAHVREPIPPEILTASTDSSTTDASSSSSSSTTSSSTASSSSSSSTDAVSSKDTVDTLDNVLDNDKSSVDPVLRVSPAEIMGTSDETCMLVKKQLGHSILRTSQLKSLPTAVRDTRAAYIEDLLNEAFFHVENLKGDHEIARNGYSVSGVSEGPSTFDPRHKKQMMNELNNLSNDSSTVSWSSSILVRVDDSDMDFLRAVITGADSTPYANGFFAYDIKIPPGYPNTAPQVLIITRGNGTVRFNPNLYSNGKVCLSLLGTWSGPGWDSKYSTLYQVLLSIQSIVMNRWPYENEPSYDGLSAKPRGKVDCSIYNAEVRLATLRFAMTKQIQQPPKGFEQAVKIHFYYKKDEIKQQAIQWIEEAILLARYQLEGLRLSKLDPTAILERVKKHLIRIQKRASTGYTTSMKLSYRVFDGGDNINTVYIPPNLPSAPSGLSSASSSSTSSANLYSYGSSNVVVEEDEDAFSGEEKEELAKLDSTDKTAVGAIKYVSARYKGKDSQATLKKMRAFSKIAVTSVQSACKYPPTMVVVRKVLAKHDGDITKATTEIDNVINEYLATVKDGATDSTPKDSATDTTSTSNSSSSSSSSSSSATATSTTTSALPIFSFKHSKPVDPPIVPPVASTTSVSNIFASSSSSSSSAISKTTPYDGPRSVADLAGMLSKLRQRITVKTETTDNSSLIASTSTSTNSSSAADTANGTITSTDTPVTVDQLNTARDRLIYALAAVSSSRIGDARGTTDIQPVSSSSSSSSGTATTKSKAEEETPYVRHALLSILEAITAAEELSRLVQDDNPSKTNSIDDDKLIGKRLLLTDWDLLRLHRETCRPFWIAWATIRASEELFTVLDGIQKDWTTEASS